MTVTFTGIEYECDAALRGDDYVELFVGNEVTVTFFDVVDFDEFELSGGDWTYPYVTLLSTGWTGTSAPYTQQVNFLGVTPTNDVLISPRTEGLLADELEVLTSAQILATYQGAGFLKFSCYGEKPTSDVEFNVKTLF